jgi:hypothetical protein
MNNANNELITDIAYFQGHLLELDKIFSKAVEFLANIKEEINDYNETNIFETRRLLKENRNYMRTYKEKGNLDISNLIRSTLIGWCEKLLSCIEGFFNLATSTNGKVLAYRIKADVIRYQIELYGDDNALRQQFIQDALVTYYSAIELAKGLPIENVNRLGTILNYAVLISDELYDIDRSIQILKDAIRQLKDYYEKKNTEEEDFTKDIYDIMVENLNYYQDNRLLYLEEKNKIS